jgi:antitoxin (DNA-binding transcriptional repressor) of toxin-antitoxin stability system
MLHILIPGPEEGHMQRVGVRELRHETPRILDLVAAGETVAITFRGRTVARMSPLRSDRRWVARDQFVGRILRLQPDRRLADDVRSVAPETTG